MDTGKKKDGVRWGRRVRMQAGAPSDDKAAEQENGKGRRNSEGKEQEEPEGNCSGVNSNANAAALQTCFVPSGNSVSANLCQNAKTTRQNHQHKGKQAEHPHKTVSVACLSLNTIHWKFLFRSELMAWP
eukprot:3272107-Rhodomonas_salina.1